MTLIETVKSYWAAHGTKILGTIVGLVGVAGESLALIQSWDPKRAALWGMVIGAAVAVVNRGFTNTKSTEKAVLAAGWTPPPPAGPPAS